MFWFQDPVAAFEVLSLISSYRKYYKNAKSVQERSRMYLSLTESSW